MTTEQINEFIVLAEQRNYLIASEIMFVTQSTLSRHIMALEEELGVTLFSRTTKHVDLTREGTRFLLFARQVSKIEKTCNELLSKAKREKSGELRIGYNYLISLYNINKLFANFIVENSYAKINIIEDASESLITMIKDGVCDIAVLLEDPYDKVRDLETITLAKDKPVVVVNNKSPLSKKKSIKLEEIKDYKFVTSSPETKPMSILFEMCKRNNIEVDIAKTGFVGNQAYEYIKNNPEYTTLDLKKPTIEHQLNGTTVLDIDIPLDLKIVIVYNKNTINSLGKKVISYLVKKVKDNK